jgi:hypothetical protein
MPWSTAFGSSIWDPEKGLAYPLGEIDRPKNKTWVDGSGICVGQLLGPREWWRSGIPAAENRCFCWPASGGIEFFGQAVFRTSVTEVFSVPGQFVWTCPAGVTSVFVECWGCGGFSSGAPNLPQGGSGGGGYSRSILTVVPGTDYPLLVGGVQLFPAPLSQPSAFDSPNRVRALGGRTGLDTDGGQGGPVNFLAIGQVRFAGGWGASSDGTFNAGGGASAGPEGDGLYPQGLESPDGALAGPGAGYGGPGWDGSGDPVDAGGPGGGAGAYADTVGPGPNSGLGQVRLTYLLPP